MTRTHTVEQGECLSSIAAKYGFSDWRVIFDCPENALLRMKRPNPNVLLPGDTVQIPSICTKAVSCHTGESARFVVKRPKNELILVLKEDTTPIRLEECSVSFAGSDGEPWGTVARHTSAQGELRAEIPKGACYARVVVKRTPPLSWSLALGHLDPVRDRHVPFAAEHCRVTGIQARLNNLGYSCGDVDGVIGPRTRTAIRAFQTEVLGRTDADGAIDQETCDRLEAAHGS